jgi:CRP-like cAMP-binding protein
MNLNNASLKIIEDNNCPLYKLGDEFKFSGEAMMLPRDRMICLILAEDIINFIKTEGYPVIYCSGCTGLIGLEYTEGEDPSGDESTIDPNDIDTIASLLSDFSFFQTLDEPDIKKLVSYLKLKKFMRDDIVIKKGEPGTRLFIILFGKIEVVGDNGISIAFLGKGEVFGEMSLLSGDPVGATIKVVDPTTLLYINGKHFRHVLKQFPSLQMYFARLLARRLAKTNVVRTEDLSSGMSGKLSDMPPSELFQTLNVNQKTGMLTLQLPKGSADLSFREGSLISVKYNDAESEEAFYEILKEREGRFKFTPGLSEEQMQAAELGDFMWLLMEGIRRMDEQESVIEEEFQEPSVIDEESVDDEPSVIDEESIEETIVIDEPSVIGEESIDDEPSAVP